MAIYGIPTQSTALNASTNADTLSRIGATTSRISAVSVVADAGNDIINLGALGYTAAASAVLNLKLVATSIAGTGIYSGTVSLVGSGTYSTSVIATANNGIAGTILTGATVTGVITSQQAARILAGGSQLYGNAGNDTIYLGGSLTEVATTTVGGGAGDDLIGTITYVNSQSAEVTAAAATITAAFFEGGGGNDTIYLGTTGSTITSTTIQGSQGDDLIRLGAGTASTLKNTLIAGGGGNDTITAQFGVSTSTTINGGGGNDTITINSQALFKSQLINGDTFNAASNFDGDDTIRVNVTGAAASAVTIQAGAGNDTVYFSARTNGGNNLFQLNAGNDSGTFQFLSADTIQAGAGNDTIIVKSSLLATQVILGGGNDTLDFGAIAQSATKVTNSTVYGGLGADTITGNVSGGAAYGVYFGYSSFADSTLSAMDTIAIGNKTRTGDYSFWMEGLTVSRADNFSSTVATGTNGRVVFTSTFNSDVTSRVDSLNSSITTVGAVAFFQNGLGDRTYMFVQGGSDDTVIQVGSAASAALGAVTVNTSLVTYATV